MSFGLKRRDAPGSRLGRDGSAAAAGSTSRFVSKPSPPFTAGQPAERESPVLEPGVGGDDERVLLGSPAVDGGDRL